MHQAEVTSDDSQSHEELADRSAGEAGEEGKTARTAHDDPGIFG
jgi:hypothetical protein